MKVFIAGVMQGNRTDSRIHVQDYRDVITKMVTSVSSAIEIIDPDKTDPNRLNYSDEQAAEMFFKYCKMASEVDLLISYLPEASMGSAVEMWNAHESKIPIITISPFIHNWVIKLLSTEVYPTINSFQQALESGKLSKYLVP